MADVRRLAELGMATELAKEVATQIDAAGGDAVASVNGQTGVVVLDAQDVGALAEPTPATAIADVTVTGTYADDDQDIEAAINGILAVLRSNGFIAT